jgi:hypothetical protein
MLLIEDRIDALREAIRGSHADQWRRLHEQCDWYRTQRPPAEHPRASITYLGPAAANLALAYRLTGQRGYLEEAWRWIGAAISFPHWGKAHLPDHDLDAGWLLHGLSLAYSWLRDDLSPSAEKALRDKLELQGERLYEHAVRTEGDWWSSSYWQNHNWICYAGLATAGYALGRADWTSRARDNFEQVIDLLPADGSDCEGIVYWRYGVPWLAIYLDLLRDAEGVDWWSRFRFLSRTFWYRLHQAAPGFDRIIDHGDCHDRRSGHSVALYYKLAAQYGIGEARWLADLVAREHFWREAYASGVKPGVMPEAYLELLWYDPSVAPVPPDPAARVGYFPDLGLLAARTGWDADAAMVSFKAAPGGGHGAWEAAERFRAERGWRTLSAGHHHPDAGAFVLVARGAFLAVDEGYSNRKKAEHHNLVLVDGQGWADQDRYHVYQEMPYERRPRLRDVLAEDGFAHATAETGMMFAPELGVTRLDRTLVFTPQGRLVLLDRLAADEPREWTFLLHSDWPAEIVAGDLAVLRSGPAQAWIRRFTPSAARVRCEETLVEANPTASTPSLAISTRLATLKVSTERLTDARFLTAIETTSALDPVPSSASELNCDSGAGVAFGDGERVLLAPVEHRIDGGDVTARAAAVIVSGDRIGVVEATSVRVDGATVWSSQEPYTGVVRP